MIEPSLLGSGQDLVAKELAKIATAQVVEAKPGSLEGTGLKGALFVPGSLRCSVTEGPAMQDPLQNEIPWGHMPFAYRLRRSLEQLGAVIGLEETPTPSPYSRLFTQLHVQVDRPEDLAAEIFRRFGPHITFGVLAIPRGLDCVSWSRSGQVWVRHVVDYNVGYDAMVQRWDVLVRKT